MREAIAGLFAVLVVVPMLIVSQLGFASRSWILDGEFYRSVTADERLYEGWEGGAAIALAEAASDEGYAVDTAALETALAAAYTDAELARAVSSFAGDTMNRLKTLPVGGSSSIDLRGLKRDVQGRLGPFAEAYASAVPVGMPASERDLSVRPSSVKSDVWASLISERLSSALREAPEEVPVSGPPTEMRRIPLLRRETTMGALYDAMLFRLGGFTALAWISCSMLARSRWRYRFMWLGSTLGFSSVFPIATGAVMLLFASPLAQSGSTMVAERLSGAIAEIYRAAGSDAQRIASVLAQALSRVGRTFFTTGLIGAAVAAALSSARFFSSDDAPEKDEHGRD